MDLDFHYQTALWNQVGYEPKQNHSSVGCQRLWDPVNARFEQCAVPFVCAIIPGVATICVLLCQLLRPLKRYRPIWLSNFIQKPKWEAAYDVQDSRSPVSRVWSLLLAIAVGGLTAQTVTIFLPSLDFYASTGAVTWLIITILIAIERPSMVSASLIALFASIAVSQIIFLVDDKYHEKPKFISSIIETVVSILGLIILLNMPIRDPRTRSSSTSKPFHPPTAELSSPEECLTLWQWMTISWMGPLISLGSSRQLNDEDVWKLSFQFEHSRLHEAFRELRGSVVSRLLQANGLDLIITSLLGILEMCANFTVPVLLQKLLASMEDPLSPRSAAVKYSALTLAVRFVAAQSAVFSLWFSRRAYERSRGEMITMLHEKTLSRKIIGAILEAQPDQEVGQVEANGLLPPSKSSSYWKDPLKLLTAVVFRKNHAQYKPVPKSAKEPADKGKILNILRNDAYEVAQRFWEFPQLITLPLGIILAVILVWKFIGWPCLIGILTVLIAQFVNVFLIKVALHYEKIRRVTTDRKLQKISQVVESIRHLRWYAWQNSWLRQIMDARQHELNYFVITGLLRALIRFMNTLAAGMFPVAAFWAYTALAGYQLRIDIAFPALQLFTMLQDHLRRIPGLITVLLNASVAMGRINDFMNEPDLANEEGDDGSSMKIALRNASFSWPGFQRQVLNDITLAFPVGITVVCGEVGSGKTALLQALLGELDRKEGDVFRPNESMGYCAQNPWLQSMSIRENILFGSPYEELRYKQVIDACALIPDLATFKDGDLSNIGENGIGLSGGQKARVALARALYNRAKILLLDDPISALDYQTSESVVRKCFGGSLVDGRIVVLVTHRVELCQNFAEQIIEISHGHPLFHAPAAKGAGDFKAVLPTTYSNDKSHQTIEEEELAALPEKFIEEEHRAHGGVGFSVYWAYIKAGKLRWWFILIIVLVIFRFLGVAQSWFLKEWGEAYEESHTQGFSDLFSLFPPPDTNIRPWLLCYFTLAAVQSVAFLVAQSFMVLIVYTAGRRMFSDAMDRICGATFRYYDVTPVGRLMNRLTSDISTIDGNISQRFHDMTWLAISWIASIVVIAGVTPIFLVFSAVLAATFALIFKRFLPTSQSLRRLELVSLSPLMSNFGVLLDGLMTVRAFCAQPRFQDRVIAVTDAFQKQDHFYWCLQAWLMYRLDVLSAFSTFILTLLAVYTGVSPGLTAFALISASKFVIATHSICKVYGQLQMDFVSVERVVELLDLEQEAPGSQEPPAWWPSYNGDIVFEDVSIRYISTHEPALSEVSFKIKGGSTTAIVGRTGSGKSTLALALLATIAPESGTILIDGMDVSQVDKQALRSRVTFLAQDPVLFPGSMRQNLDPLGDYSDEDCSRVLERVCGSHGWTLNTQLDTGGKNFSQGQRQLVGLARAILRRSPIIILDEATASIDMATSMQIQEILREEMAESTVITIAHRVEAVRNADYCIMLSRGKILKQGPANEILTEL